MIAEGQRHKVASNAKICRDKHAATNTMGTIGWGSTTRKTVALVQ
jgi:hypothetical protein